jgi:hypothetical protein
MCTTSTEVLVDDFLERGVPEAPVFSAESRVLRLVPRGALALTFVAALFGELGLVLVFAMPTLLAWRVLPWGFVVDREGILVAYGLDRRRFLSRHDVVVRAGLCAPVVFASRAARCGIPLPGVHEPRRRAELRALLRRNGFRLAA